MISAQTCSAFVAKENRCTLFRIMRWRNFVSNAAEAHHLNVLFTTFANDSADGNPHRRQGNRTMLRWALPLLVTVAAFGNASAADLAPGYDYRATVIQGTPPPPPAYVAPAQGALISSFVWTTPLLPGSYTLPGYYGRPFDYYYQGAYYGGPYGNGYWTYFVREPYACGVTGYC